MLRQIKDPKFLLVYPPLQFQDGEVVRPDGCLANAYLDSSLTKAGYETKIIDMAVGDESKYAFAKQPSGRTTSPS
jgi:hypothetical protein